MKRIYLTGVLAIATLAPVQPAQSQERFTGDTSSASAVAGAPPSMPALHGESIIVDAARGTLVLFGGRAASGPLNGTWEWDGHGFHETVDSAGSPPSRAGHAMAYDRANRRVVLFGGMSGPSTRHCDTWTYSDSRWTRAAAGACITDRGVNASLVFDSRRRRMLLADGPAIANETPRPLRLWEWKQDAWALVDSAGPQRVGFSAAAFDDARGVLVVPVLFGGPDAGVWEWNGEDWKQVRAAGPSTRQTYALTYDARRRRVVLVGGQGGRAGPYFDEEWTWDGARWAQTARPRGPVPPGRGGATLLGDSARGRLLYFGGYGDSLLADLWARDAGGWRRLPR